MPFERIPTRMKLLALAISFLTILVLLLQPCAAARPVSQTPTIDGSLSVHLPLCGSLLCGPESVAFDVIDAGPYNGVSNGCVLKWNGPVRVWTSYAYNLGYEVKPALRPGLDRRKSRRASAAAHWVCASTTSLGISTSPTLTRG
ncbi:unnamed protein product [Urochloa humidicola]